MRKPGAGTNVPLRPDLPGLRAGTGHGDAGRFQRSVSGNGRVSLWAGEPRSDRIVSSIGITNQDPGSLSRGGQHPSWTRPSDGGTLGLDGCAGAGFGPCFDRKIPPGGYGWWYVDAWSDDGAHGLTIIAFVGSVFSPYYARARRRNNGAADPEDFCAINVALYGPHRRWSMTERGRGSLDRTAAMFRVGPSSLTWGEDGLTILLDEVGMPLPRSVRGTIRLRPRCIVTDSFTLDEAGGHAWRPISPLARVEVRMECPDLSWGGDGYFDTNSGNEPIEKGFSQWTWSCARTPKGATIFYDAERRRGPQRALAIEIDHQGFVTPTTAPPVLPMASTLWRIGRSARCDAGKPPQVLATLEDTPFYARSRLRSEISGESVCVMHESLSLDRFRSPIVQMMLPFRMPRRS